MEKCSKNCIPICDFCEYYHPYYEDSFWKSEPVLTGEGLCDIMQKTVDAGIYCDDFKCVNITKRSMKDV